jgi:hypothetical protein
VSLAAPPAARRWRAFAAVVAAALGGNVWVSMVVLPGLFVGALHDAGVAAAAAAAPALLAVGLWRRSEGVLLGWFPAAVLLPVVLAPTMASTQVYGPWRFAVVAVGLVAYLLGVAFFTTFHEPRQPVSVRPLASAAQPTPARWRRRERMYALLTLLAAAGPVFLVHEAAYDHRVRAAIAAGYPDRTAAMGTLVVLAAVALATMVHARVLLEALRLHRTGDRELVTTLAIARADAGRGRPRARFYVGVVLALALMAALVAVRHA